MPIASAPAVLTNKLLQHLPTHMKDAINNLLNKHCRQTD